MQKLKIGDTVQVMSGEERSQKANRGKIIEIDKTKGRVRVEGLRMVKRHIAKGKDRTNPEGGIVEKVGSIELSERNLVCLKCDKATRVGVRAEGEKKKRFRKQCEATID